MRHVYRRPFDYSVPRRFSNIWLAANAVEGALGSAAFTTYAAAVSASTSAVNVAGPTGSRFTSLGVYRRRWNYAQINARIDLFYTDLTTIAATVTSAGFEGYAATVELGVNVATDVAAGSEIVASATYDAVVEAYSRDSIVSDGALTATTYTAEIAGEYGLGVSRTGPAQVKAVGTYSGGTVRQAGRRPVVSITSAIAKRK